LLGQAKQSEQMQGVMLVKDVRERDHRQHQQRIQLRAVESQQRATILEFQFLRDQCEKQGTILHHIADMTQLTHERLTQ